MHKIFHLFSRDRGDTQLPHIGLMCSLILLLSSLSFAGFLPFSRALYSSQSCATVIPVRSAFLSAGSSPNASAQAPSRLPVAPEKALGLESLQFLPMLTALSVTEYDGEGDDVAVLSSRYNPLISLSHKIVFSSMAAISLD